MFKHSFDKRIRYSETDKMGYLYYGNYAALYEIGRVEMMRYLDFPYSYMEDVLGVMLPVFELSAKYKLPIYYDELVTIESTIPEMPNRFLNVNTIIKNKKNVVVHKAETKLCFVNKNTNKIVRVPKTLEYKLSFYF